MEQVNMNTAKDNERIYKVINDLIKQNKEFQIMITVPAAVQKEKNKETEPVQSIEKSHDLEKDVTDMIHDIGVHDEQLLFRGSSNQRLIDVPQSLREGKVVLWEQNR